ncbi:MAG TPA: serine/threonine-protein kinase [Trichormus sp.]|jgi:serine/threonine protein kinase
MPSSDKSTSPRKGRTCAICGNVYDVSLTFCPKDGNKLSDVLVESERLLVSLVDTANMKTSSGDADKTLRQSNRDFDNDAPLSADAVSRHPSTTPEALIGTTVDNRFSIESIIGTGGMSAVYKASDVYLKHHVALKMLLPHTMHFPLSMQRFQQEAQAACHLKHDNVVRVHSFGVDQVTGRAYLAMDCLEGQSLDAIVGERRTISVDRALHIFIQVADALSHAHEKGVIHRDLKPSNVILVQNGHDPDFVKIVDFGIAKLLNQEGSDAARLTQTGEVFGSPMYMSPEQSRGDKLDSRADIYSLGCLMYEALAGDPPHSGSNSLEILYKHINIVPPPMSEVGVTVPQRLEKIIFKALAKDPAERYQTMDTLSRDLTAFANERKFGVFARLKDQIELAWLKRRPKSVHEKAIATVCGALLIVIMMLGSWVFYLYWAALNSPANKKHLVWREPVGIYAQSEDQVQMTSSYGGLVTSVDENPLARIKAKMKIANMFMHLGKWQQAIEPINTAYADSATANGESAVATFRIRKQLAECYYRIGEYVKAKTLFDKEFKDSRTLPIPDMMMSTIYVIYGDIMSQENKLLEAERSYKHAISMAMDPEGFSSAHAEYSEKFPAEPPSDDFVICIGKLADVERLRHDYDEAQKYYSQVISYCDVVTNAPGADASEKERRVTDAFVNDAIACDRLASVQMQVGQQQKALNNYKRSLELVQDSLGRNHTYCALITRDYADGLWRSGHYFDALLQQYKALNIFANAD